MKVCIYRCISIYMNIYNLSIEMDRYRLDI